jgi:phage terminase large subunit-like protein
LIEATPGEAIDYDRIRMRINELGQKYAIRGIAIDRWNATQLAGQLAGDGFEMMAFGQGYASMNAPTKRLEQLVLNSELAHGGHPVLRWMADNVSLETDAADNWKPSKKKSRERIDGIVGTNHGAGDRRRCSCRTAVGNSGVEVLRKRICRRRASQRLAVPMVAK